MYNEILCNFNNILQAYHLAHRSKTNCDEIIEFDINKMYNLNIILNKLKNKEGDKIFVYYRFIIHEPKERIVDALTFEGRIVQHVLCDKILKPYFEPRLIKENCACRVGKGTDYAINLLKQGMVKFLKKHDDGYVLKMDIKKYFPSINREILKKMLKKFPDAEILDFIYGIIDHCPDDNGLPIGNQTSQGFALYYLDKIDRIIKEKYRIKYYVRYMDDLIIIHEDKNVLNNLLTELSSVASNELDLEFNQKTQIFPLHKGIPFLGWKFLYTKETKKIIQKIERSKKALRNKRIKRVQDSFIKGKINLQEYNNKTLSIINFLKKGNTYKYRESREVGILPKKNYK